MRARFRPIRSVLAIAAAIALLLAACGSDDDDAADENDESAETTAEPSTTAESAADDADEDGAESEEAAPVDGEPVDLGEWFITIPDDLTAGPVTFALTNSSTEFPHAFAIARGTSYEELPQLDNGAVDTDALGDDFLGGSENVEVGATGSISFDLEPGDYVFFCPIQFGPNSHAARGQVLSVTIP